MARNHFSPKLHKNRVLTHADYTVYSVNGLGQRVGRTDSTGTATFAVASDAIDANVLGDGSKLYQYGLGLLSFAGSPLRVFTVMAAMAVWPASSVTVA